MNRFLFNLNSCLIIEIDNKIIIFGDNMPGQGSTGNVIAALASFFIPGLGQLLQGRVLPALIQFVLAGVLWIFLLGWIVHLWSIIDAARFKS
jgi:TM2 domain-containing membrane protein YozV